MEKLQIFRVTQRDIQALKDSDQRGDGGALRRQMMEQAAIDKGMREHLGAWLEKSKRDLRKELVQLRHEMPNFAGVLEIIERELALALVAPPGEFWVTPILLDGPPGVGKTLFARRLARVLGVRFESVALGASSGGFGLAGTSAHYSSSRPGRIFSSLASSRCASPVILLDEVDKASGDRQFPVIPALLDLLEPTSGQQWRDESMELTCDASRVIYIGTCNSTEGMSEPLLSRFEVVRVGLPSADQLVHILRHMASEIAGVSFPRGVIEDMAERAATLDLRTCRRILRGAAGQVLVQGRKRVALSDLSLPTSPRRAVGFV